MAARRTPANAPRKVPVLAPPGHDLADQGTDDYGGH
jgi:hypothetical protein